MRRIVVVILFLLALGWGPEAALGAGYNSDGEISAGGVPHGGYATTGNNCKSCHATHLGTGNYRLLRANSEAATCDYCHGASGIIGGKKVWLDAFGHGTTQTVGSVVAPDDTTNTSFPVARWGCLSCHSVHDSDTVVLDGEPGVTTSKLLKKAPNSANKTYPLDSGYDSEGTSQTVTLWCTNCHEGNYGLHTDTRTVGGQDVWGHDSSETGYVIGGDSWVEVDPGDGVNKGPKCKQCHPADGAPAEMAQKFPHAGGYDESSPTAGGEKMLRDTARVDKLDFVCTGSPCHNVEKLP